MSFTYSLEGQKWGSTAIGSAGGTVTWSLDTGTGHFFNFINATVPDFLLEISAAFSRWEQVANIHFVQVTDSTSVDIRLGEAPIDGLNNTLGETNYSFSGSAFNFAEIAFDSAEYWTDPLLYEVALHEIGHALGLAHHTADPSIMEPVLDPSLTDLQPYDIATIQYLYGAAQLQIVAGVEHGVLIQNRTTHEMDFLDVNNTTLSQSAQLNNNGFWHVAGEGDFNGDGQIDLITQNNGQIDFAFMVGSSLVASNLVNGTYWDVKGGGQFAPFGGATSVVTQDAQSGQINLLKFNGSNLVSSNLYEGFYWNVVGVGDFNHDGKDDIVTQKNGAIDILFFTGTKLTGSCQLSGTYWDVKGVEDFNHDGWPDLITQNATSGQIDDLTLNGTTVTGFHLESTAVPGWDVVGASHVADQFWHI